MSPLSLSPFGARIAGSGCSVGLPHGMLCPRAGVAGPRAIDLRGAATDDDEEEMLFVSSSAVETSSCEKMPASLNSCATAGTPSATDVGSMIGE